MADERGQGGFERQASESSPGLVREMWDFLRANKKWWLLPILLVFLLVGVLVVLAATGAAPIVYTFW